MKAMKKKDWQGLNAPTEKVEFSIVARIENYDILPNGAFRQ
jgi:hypothetical protein